MNPASRRLVSRLALVAPLAFVACAPATVVVRESVTVRRPPPPPPVVATVTVFSQPAPVTVAQPVTVVQPVVIEQPAPVVVVDQTVNVRVVEIAPGPAPAVLVLETIPQTAFVYVDDVFVTRGPLHVRVAPGVHTVRIEAPGFEVVEQRVTVGARETIRPTFSFVAVTVSTQSVAQTGNLEVRSHLEGAVVLVDGRERGRITRGNDFVRGLSGGNHTLELMWRNHAYAVRVHVDSGRTDAVEVEAPH
jgi:hypothetical protein